MGGVSIKKKKITLLFLLARSLDLTCTLTTLWQFSSPRFRPCCWNKGVLTEASVTGYHRLDLQCWECIFPTHREAQSDTVGSFHSKSWVLLTAGHSQCVYRNVKKLSPNSIILEFLLSDLAKTDTASYVKCLSEKKISFWTLISMQISEVSGFGTFHCDFCLLNG